MRRTHPDVYEVLPQPPLPAAPEQVIAALRERVADARLARVAEVAAQRRAGVIPVLEEIADPHNVAAILRSADAFGVAELRVVAGDTGFFAARQVSKGSDRWLDLKREQSAEACVEGLRATGHHIVVASMQGRLGPSDLASIPRLAVIFGNEHRGPSEVFRSAADDTYAIPMRGFVESLNVSVAAAITLQAALHGRPAVDEGRARALQARYLLASVRSGREWVERWLERRPRADTSGATGID